MLSSCFVLALAGFLSGVFMDIPVGVVQLEMIKRSVSGRLKEALLIVAGSTLSDVIYGFVAVLGVAPFIELEKIKAFFWFLSGLILFVIGFFTLFHDPMGDSKRIRPKTSFLIGFSLAVTNPSVILWWVVCFNFMKTWGLCCNNPICPVVFVFAGGFGIFVYLVILAYLVARIGEGIKYDLLFKINRVIGVLFIALSLFFVLKAFVFFLKTGLLR